MKSLILYFLINIINAFNINFVSHNEKLEYIFNLIDINKDDILEYEEMYLLQLLTEPKIPLTYEIYKEVSIHMNVNYRIGYTKEDLNMSYTLYKHDIGSDITKDYKKLFNYEIRYYM